MRFREGDPVIFVDRKGRRYLLADLKAGDKYRLRDLVIMHSDLIGREEGEVICTERGDEFLILKPTLSEYVLKMSKRTQIIYPKDMGAIITWADIFPGARVLEAGIGGGSLTMGLLRAVGKEGEVVSYETSEEFARIALTNINRYMGKVANHTLKIRDIYKGIEEEELDRIILDVPEPWHVVPHAIKALRPGGIFMSYLPTIIQTRQIVEVLKETGIFALTETIEVLFRNWEISGLSVRPAHRMVAHTGFITTARRLASPYKKYFPASSFI